MYKAGESENFVFVEACKAAGQAALERAGYEGRVCATGYNKLVGDVPVGKATLTEDGTLRIRVSKSHYLYAYDGQVELHELPENTSDTGREVEVNITIEVKG